MKGKLALTALAILAFLAFSVTAWAANIELTKVTKQTGGGSTGDSLTAGADTSSAVQIPRSTTALRVFAAADSQSIYITQIAIPGSSYWFTIDTDTVAAGAAEATADFGSAYAGMSIRVIMDPIPAAASEFGAAWVTATK